MSTDSQGNGVDDLGGYGTRTNTWAALEPVDFDDLNAIQDGIIDTAGRMSPMRNASIVQAQTPAPNANGGISIYVEATTAGVAVVVLDTSIDWRDRMLFLQGFFENPGTTKEPGGVNDDILGGDLNLGIGTGFHHAAYTQLGHTGTVNSPGFSRAPATDIVRIFARSSDGALCMSKSGTADPNQQQLFAFIKCSPKQNDI